MPRTTDSIFAHGPVIVPDFVTPAEEARILLRIAEAPWLTEHRRRVQHYGYQYNYRGASRPVPAAPFPRWVGAMAERLRPHFGGALPVQCIVNEYRPAGHRDARRPPRLRRRCRLALARRLVADALPAAATRVPTPRAMPGDEVAVLPAARSSSSPAPPAIASCTASTAPTPRARP